MCLSLTVWHAGHVLLTIWSSCCHSIAASVVQRIYIALPEEKARAHMFKVHLGDTPNDLSAQDFEELARHTDGFSGSDVAVVVKDVLMEPVRLTQDAGYFRFDLPANVGQCHYQNLLIPWRFNACKSCEHIYAQF